MSGPDGLRELSTQDIPCGYDRAHPAHVYRGVDPGSVWYCDGTWPKSDWEKMGEALNALGREIWKVWRPPLQWTADRLARWLG